MRDLRTVLCCKHLSPQSRYPLFTLCPDCCREAPHEAIIVEAVVRYFSKPEFSKFYIQTEHKIQMGVDNRRADIVLLDSSENCIAMAECKRAAVGGSGIDQLKSYLCATDTQFGIFANSTDPSHWAFYENLRRNRFKEITCDQLETGFIGEPQPIKPTNSRRSLHARRRRTAMRTGR